MSDLTSLLLCYWPNQLFIVDDQDARQKICRSTHWLTMVIQHAKADARADVYKKFLDVFKVF